MPITFLSPTFVEYTSTVRTSFLGHDDNGSFLLGSNNICLPVQFRGHASVRSIRPTGRILFFFSERTSPEPTSIVFFVSGRQRPTLKNRSASAVSASVTTTTTIRPRARANRTKEGSSAFVPGAPKSLPPSIYPFVRSSLARSHAPRRRRDARPSVFRPPPPRSFSDFDAVEAHVPVWWWGAREEQRRPTEAATTYTTRKKPLPFHQLLNMCGPLLLVIRLE